MTRAGGLVCRKRKLKNVPDPKPAGGCGVAPFLSAASLFCRGMAAPACRGAFDRFGVLLADVLSGEALTARLTKGHKKARTLAG